ncbi:MAG: PleD family two-component system response regulator [Rhizobiales bacterium 65-9]|nr:PleD family two-component system response regulator [Hyphomicrobiales bacterium]OJY34005.1 MAG: PleD family two-component system response regulator [Rhizobiales bacterium 65-9]
MTGRVLVVDDLFPNLRLLEARLSAEYYEVLTATNGPDAIALCRQGLCDLVLLDVMMPGMDGFEVCRRLKSDAATMHIPVVMVTALDQPSDRVRGLDAGADDFLTKPIDEIALLARARSLVRLKQSVDELRNRAQITRDVGLGDPLAVAAAETGLAGNVLVVEDRPSAAERIATTLDKRYAVVVEGNPQQAVFRAVEGQFDLAIVSLGLVGFDGLRLLSQFLSLDRTRHMGTLMIGESEDRQRLLRGLDIGVQDFLMRPIDRNELLARVRTQIRNKRYADRLRLTVASSMEAAVLDQLTGLHNRRYFDRQMPILFSQAKSEAKPMSVFVLDIDRFKTINDTYGHEAGDEVLRAFAKRVRSCIRGEDMLVRFGGEEVVIVSPETSDEVAALVAERIRDKVQSAAFVIERGSQQIPVTVSIGLAHLSDDDETAGDLLKRADDALYRAKSSGRNKVIRSAA